MHTVNTMHDMREGQHACGWGRLSRLPRRAPQALRAARGVIRMSVLQTITVGLIVCTALIDRHKTSAKWLPPERAQANQPVAAATGFAVTTVISGKTRRKFAMLALAQIFVQGGADQAPRLRHARSHIDPNRGRCRL